jgi:hypothetical protein
MPIISHVSYNTQSDLESIITQNDGSPLYGEIEMFRRIYSDCSKSEDTWHFWHNLRLPVSVKKQNEIQIDFLLVSEKGVVIVEVKGGKIGIEQGLYYYEASRERTYMERAPFDQARDYMYAPGNKKMLNMLILEILEKYTDGDHRLTQQEILRLLKDNYDVECDRRSVRNNAEYLIDLGYDISLDDGYCLL